MNRSTGTPVRSPPSSVLRDGTEQHVEQSPDPIVETFDLTKRYGSNQALDHVSFSIEEGELFGLLGPNGAGKSTLINMLVTLLGPTSGTATVNGHDITDEPGAVRNNLGIVFQEPALDEELTGAENLAFHSRLYGQGKADRRNRIHEVFELIGLSDERDDPVGTYSGGMKRRLEIGRGLLHEPEVLFLDEPTVGLDARARRDTWEYIQEINRDGGITIVMTTHYIEEAEQLCDRVAVIDNGAIAAIDSPTTLKESLGGDMVALDIDGPTDELSHRLEGHSWVEGYTETDSGIHITLEHGETRIAELVLLADESGATVTAVDLHRPTLETVFLSLTGSTIEEREAETAGSATLANDANERTDASDARAELEVGEE